MTLSGDTDDGTGSGVTKVVCAVQGAAEVTATLLGNGHFTASVALPAEDRSFRLTAVATDHAGNQASASVDVTVDTRAPQLAISTPSLDASCTTAQCVGAVLNLQSGPSQSFSGTVSAVGGLSSSGDLVAWIQDLQGVVVSSLTPTVTGGDWAAQWNNLPSDDGRGYDFVIRATDAAGRATQVVRRVWVDRVAPLAIAGVGGQRLVSRTARLVTFSEPMDSASVIAAASLSPGGAPGASFGASADGKSFGFSVPGDLSTYQVYLFAITTGAIDRAGNPLASPVQLRFLTEMAPVPNPLQLTDATHPKLALDVDGRPFVVYTVVSTGALRFAYWDGRGLQSALVALTFPGATHAAADLLVLGQPAADLTLTPSVELLVGGPGGGDVAYARTLDLVNWGGRGSAPDLISTNGATTSGSASFLLAPGRGGLQTDILYATDTEVSLATPAATGWSTTSLASVGTPPLLGGASGAWSKSLYGIEPGVATLIGTTGLFAFTSPAGHQQLFAPDLTRVGSAFVFAQEVLSLKGAPPMQLYCSAKPSLAGTWQKADLGTPYLAESLNQVAIAVSPSTVAVAIAQASGLRIATAPNGACTGAPVVGSWSPAITGTEPALAFGPGDSLWKAYSSGSLVVVSH